MMGLDCVADLLFYFILNHGFHIIFTILWVAPPAFLLSIFQFNYYQKTDLLVYLYTFFCLTNVTLKINIK